MSGARLPDGNNLIRAGLVLLTAGLGEYRTEQVLHAAAAAELIRAATLTHDDLIDPAERRRGDAATNDWDNGVVLMVGDYLFALAAGEMALSPDARVISFYSEAVQQIAESALTPVTQLQPADEAYEAYITRATGASAALLAAACRSGAACGGLDEAAITAAGVYGRNLGLAAHISAEIRALEQTPDSARAIISLPLIYAAAHSDAERLLAALDSADPVEQQWLATSIHNHGIGPARAEARRLTDTARATLDVLPDGETRRLLADLAQQGIARL
ncbi:MAG: polyprenyl synthetase [Oscillochloris sp.]|nr:polyprenyl synthetase [Oscillochloris sp.]